MLHNKETSVKKLSLYIGFLWNNVSLFCLCQANSDAACDCPHIYTACTQVIRFGGGFQLTLCVIFQEEMKAVWTSEMLKPYQIIQNHNVEDHSTVCFVYYWIIAVQSVSWKANKTCTGSRGKLSDRHSGDAGSVPGQSIWNLWWIKWCWDRFPTNYFGVSLYHSTSSMSSSQWCILAFHMSTTNTVWS